MILTKDRATYLTVFLFFLLFVPTSHFGLYANVSSKMSKAWQKLEKSQKLKDSHSIKFSRKKQTQVFNAFRKASDIIENFYFMTDALDAIEETEYFQSKSLSFMQKMEDIRLHKLRIMSHFKTVQQYHENLDTVENSNLLYFAESSVSPYPFSLREYVQKIHYILFGAEEQEEKAAKIFEQLANDFKKSNDKSCRKQQSAQQYLYLFYNDIVATELKGLILLEFSWMILRVHGRGNFTTEANLARRQYQERMKRTVRILRKSLDAANRIVWRCDPLKYIEGVTYAAINKVGEAYYKKVENNKNCYGSTNCGEAPDCNGDITDCRKIKPVNMHNFIASLSSGSGTLNSIVCIECSCTCYLKGDKKLGDRLFSLHSSVADIRNNMVVTGLRFQKIERIFYLQIQQGQLLPRGAINSSTLEWLPIKTLNINTAIADIDYHEVKSSEKGVELDEVVSQLPNFVMTGVRLSSPSITLVLEVGLNEFSFETGKLISPVEVSMWQTKNFCNRRRISALGSDSGIPSLSPSKSQPKSKSNDYIEFEHTKRPWDKHKKYKDTVPFIDLQDVVSDPPIPLEGAGIYYKSVYGYGGFLAPKLLTMNLQNYPLPDLSKKNYEKINI